MNTIQRGASSVLIASLLVVMIAVPVATRDVPAPERTVPDVYGPGPRVSKDRITDPRTLHATAVPDTTVLGYWTFDGPAGQPNPQGWTPWDATAQAGDFFHVDDFAGLGGGDFGKYYALEGNQSMWCGARPDTSDWKLCGYAELPGYGNNWDQGLCTVDCLNVLGDTRIDYIIAYYTEPGYDQVDIEYDLCDENWTSLRNFSGEHEPQLLSDTVSTVSHSGQVRFRIHLGSDGAWSDEDGLWNTDGAIILDSLTVTDATGTLLPTELFEAEAVGDRQTLSGNWVSCPKQGYGDFAALFRGVDVLQKDPCTYNITHVWSFFNGSTELYDCGSNPDQPAVPKENAEGLTINNHVMSPRMEFTGNGEHVEFNFDMYRDMPLDDLIFYMWFVRSFVDECPGQWKDRASVGGYGDQRDWVRKSQWVGDLIDTGATHIQVSLGVVDMCPFWCGTVGSGTCHNHSPLYDNVEVLRIDRNGPYWWVRDIDFFQDNFFSEITGTVRADMARDILSQSNPNIVPGDSAVVRVYDYEDGLAADAYTGLGAAVYAYVAIWPVGQPGKSGAALTQDPFRYPVVDSLTYGGNTWYCMRTDTSFTNGAARTGPQPDAFCIDLNDNLFTPGDTICFVFSATSDAPGSVTSYYSVHTGPTESFSSAFDNPMEMTCLPTPGRDILYVDNYNNLGAQPFYDTAFEVLGITDRVDRYDGSGYYSHVGSGLSTRASVSQLLAAYKTIIWNSGSRDEGTIGDGSSGGMGKSPDLPLLYDYVDNLPTPGGIYFSGDNLADEWAASLAPGAVPLRAYMGYGVIDDDHKNVGQPVSPLVVGEPLGCLAGDNFVAFGGCPGYNDFDVLGTTGSGAVEASYGSAASGAGAVVAQASVNSQAQTVGVVLSGFSFHEIRDADETGIPARAEHLHKILTWLGNTIPTPTDARPSQFRNSLAQNYPNPFNPSTTVEFSLKERARVTIRVYNVAGQLVTTLLDEVRNPGVLHRATWDGVNRTGDTVASGVYFYRLETKEFMKTRKMVLLK